MNYPKVFRGVMLILGGLGVSSFEGINIIKFFERYEELDANFSLSKPEAMKRVPRYTRSQLSNLLRIC